MAEESVPGEDGRGDAGARFELKWEEPLSGWSGGTGRRTGLKIPRPSVGMWVRPPPPAPGKQALWCGLLDWLTAVVGPFCSCHSPLLTALQGIVCGKQPLFLRRSEHGTDYRVRKSRLF